ETEVILSARFRLVLCHLAPSASSFKKVISLFSLAIHHPVNQRRSIPMGASSAPARSRVHCRKFFPRCARARGFGSTTGKLAGSSGTLNATRCESKLRRQERRGRDCSRIRELICLTPTSN